MGAIGVTAACVGGAVFAGTILVPLVTIGSTAALSSTADFFGRMATSIQGHDAAAETGYKIAEWACRAFAAIAAIAGSALSGISAGSLVFFLSGGSPVIGILAGVTVAAVLGSCALGIINR
jgi:hypothetical protein